MLERSVTYIGISILCILEIRTMYLQYIFIFTPNELFWTRSSIIITKQDNK